MRILIEVRGGCVANVWCSEPDEVDVVIRDIDIIKDTMYGTDDPLDTTPGLAELRVPHFVIY